MSLKKIKITRDGPYLISGGVPLKMRSIVEQEHINIWSGNEDVNTTETVALCRCGRSENQPFCDGKHARGEGFHGEETASRERYVERAKLVEGAGVDLLDDGRCVMAGFCYVDNDDAWDLTEHSETEHNKRAAIEGACACPAGRLTAVDKDGHLIEPVLEEEIIVIQNGHANCGLYVKGGIDLESSDGEMYEKRNRYVLCCCGKSENKPFCDAAHLSRAAKQQASGEVNEKK